MRISSWLFVVGDPAEVLGRVLFLTTDPPSFYSNKQVVFIASVALLSIPTNCLYSECDFYQPRISPYVRSFAYTYL